MDRGRRPHFNVNLNAPDARFRRTNAIYGMMTRMHACQLGGFRSWGSISIGRASIGTPVKDTPVTGDRWPNLVHERWMQCRRWFGMYMELSKYRLTTLVVFSSSCAFLVRYDLLQTVDGACPTGNDGSHDARAPAGATTTERYTSDGVASRASDVSLLFFTTIGTFLCAASANALNQIIEQRNDARMRRTFRRPLPSGRMWIGHAIGFALVCGMAGVTLLMAQVNGTTGLLGLANILLYASVYTPLKTLSPINTWIGAAVGAIPPLMGWSAASGGRLTVDFQRWGLDGWSFDERGGWILAFMLFLWQIPHFHALAMLCRTDYQAGGFKMLAQLNPKLNARIAWCTSLCLIPLGGWLTYSGVTTPWFTLENALLSTWILLGSGRLVRHPESINAARPLFRASITYLPLVLLLLVIHRRNQLEEEPSLHAMVQDRNVRLDRFLAPPYPIPVPEPIALGMAFENMASDSKSMLTTSTGSWGRFSNLPVSFHSPLFP